MAVNLIGPVLVARKKRDKVSLISNVNGERGRKNATYRKGGRLMSPGKSAAQERERAPGFTTRQQTDGDRRKAAGSPERRWGRSEISFSPEVLKRRGRVFWVR